MPPTKKPKSVKEKVWTTLPPETVKKLDEQAAREQRNRPQMLRVIIEDYYKRKEGQ